jgi:EmrB/QacA subfamily drug resistance transporter
MMETINNKKIALITATMSSFMTPFMVSSINIALPSMASDLHLNAISMSWVATAYLLSAAIFLLPVGKLADMYGRKRIFIFGISIFTLSSILCSVAFNSYTMIAARVLQGIGSTMIFGTGIAIVTSVFPIGERGKAIGINASATYIGLSLGPLMGGLLTTYFGWRSIFLVVIPFGLAIIFLIIFKLQGEWSSNKKEPYDWKGAVIYSLALIILMLGFSRLSERLGLYLVISGIAALGFFIYWENRVKYPVLDIEIFRNNTSFTFSNLAALINYSATYAVIFLLSLYLQYIKGYNAREAGMILFAQPVIMALFSPVAGKLSDIYQPRTIASAGMIVTTIGLAWLYFLTRETSIYVIIANLILLGAGFALFSSPNTNAIMSSVLKSEYGVASAMVGTMRLTGQMFSMGIAMLLISIFIGTAKINPSNYMAFFSAMKICFSIFILLCFLGIFASIARGNLRREQAADQV